MVSRLMRLSQENAFLSTLFPNQSGNLYFKFRDTPTQADKEYEVCPDEESNHLRFDAVLTPWGEVLS